MSQISMEQNQNKQNNNQLYAWGWGIFGQLGIGNEKTQHFPQKIMSFQDKNITFIEAKKSVSAAITSEGELFTWGKSKGGILGRDDNTSQNVSLPTQVQFQNDEKIVFIACGQHHMIAINHKGEVYAWGNNSHGKLGHSFSNQANKVSKTNYNTRQNLQQGQLPQKIDCLIQNNVLIKQAACGIQHSILLSNEGDVYTLGENKKGVLGYDVQGQENGIPQKVSINNKIVKIDAGIDFNLALSEEGQVYSWGNNDYGQLGNNQNIFISKPYKIEGINNIKQISCGDYFSAAVDSDGKLYTWGYGNDGQLGHQNTLDVRSPKEVKFDKKVKSVSCGGGHCAVITEDNQLFMFGRGKEGQLGREELNESEASYRTSPKQVYFFNGKKVLQAELGSEHTLALIGE